MREAMIIVPKADNDGNCLLSLRNDAAGTLAEAFGGVTIREAFGCWKAPSGELMSEPVWELIAAYEPNKAGDRTMARIAKHIGDAGRQLAVYVRYASGHVEIMDTAAKAAA